MRFSPGARGEWRYETSSNRPELAGRTGEFNVPNPSAEEMVFRFWSATVAGIYCGHGETYLSPDDVLWWSKGGVLKGQSPARLAFLKTVLDDAPAEGIEPIDKWQNPEYGGRAPDYYPAIRIKRVREEE